MWAKTRGLTVFVTLNNVKAIPKKCLKRTAHSSKCWIHLTNENNLRIKPSNIQNAGKGLFSWKKSFKRNQFIDEYTGEKTSLKKLNDKYGKKVVAQYSICDGPRKCWNTYKTTDGPHDSLMTQEEREKKFLF